MMIHRNIPERSLKRVKICLSCYPPIDVEYLSNTTDMIEDAMKDINIDLRDNLCK